MSEWIKSGDRLPANKDEVLITSSIYGFRVAFWDEKRKCWDDGDFCDYITSVTHWMPLPALPKD